LAGILLVVTLAQAYLFLVRGDTRPASDGRLAIQLSAGERDMVLAEMRTFLASIQAIVTAIGRNDPAAVAVAARRVGAAAQQVVPASLVGKLPLDFKKLGFDTHERFDGLALNAEQFEDSGQALEELAELMQNCVACHAAYRIDLAVGQP